MQILWREPEQVVTKKKNGHHFNMLNSTELLTRGDNGPSNHGNHHLDITYQPWNHGYLSCHVCKGIHHHTNQNEQPSGKYRNALQYISPNCHNILSHISQSHVSPKTILIPLGENDPNNIWLIKIKIFVFEIGKVKVH